MQQVDVLFMIEASSDREQIVRILTEGGFSVRSENADTLEKLLLFLKEKKTDVLITYEANAAEVLRHLIKFDEAPLVIAISDKFGQPQIDLIEQGAHVMTSSALPQLAPFLHRELRLERQMARLQEFEKRARQAPKIEALGRLAGGVAHDFNNILGVVMLCGEQVLEEIPATLRAHKHVKTILECSKRGANLTKQLLAFTRNTPSEPQVLDMNTVIGKMEKLLKPLVGEEIEFTFEPAEDVGPVKIDPVHLEQIILNLVVNARDAMPTGGQLKIQTHNADFVPEVSGLFMVKPGNYSVISVSDTGCGMDTQTQSKIFEPFFSTKGEQGTGLGLSTVFGIVKQNRGYITVESVPQKGSTFRLYFATSELPVGVLKVSETSEIKKQEITGLSILLVEDEENLRATMSSRLENAGYKVFAAKTCFEAMAFAKTPNQHIDILLTDYIMPKMRGTDLASQIINYQPDIKILFMSGYIDLDADDFEDFQERADLIQKPFSTETLLLKLLHLKQSVKQEPLRKLLTT